jgi:hypothetical protein
MLTSHSTGLGENIRGTTLGAIDTATHKGEGTENDEIARRGRVEMEQGMSAFKGTQKNAVGNTSAGHAGGTTGEHIVGGVGTNAAPGHKTTTHTGGTGLGQNNTSTDYAGNTTGEHVGGGVGTNAGSRGPATTTHTGGTGTGQSVGSQQNYTGNIGAAGGVGSTAPSGEGHGSQGHPTAAAATTAAGAGAGALSGGHAADRDQHADLSHDQAPHTGTGNSAGLGVSNTSGNGNEGYGSQNPAAGGFDRHDPSYQTGNTQGLGSMGPGSENRATTQYPPGSQARSGGGAGESGYPDRKSEHASGFAGTGVDSQNQSGHGQTGKHTTEQFASSATAVPHHGGPQMGNDQLNHQDQPVGHGGADAGLGGPAAHHHRDDAVTDLNARPGEQHGAGHISTASNNDIPPYGRNEGFSTRQGGGEHARGAGPGGFRHDVLGQGHQGNLEGSAGAHGGAEGGGNRAQY